MSNNINTPEDPTNDNKIDAIKQLIFGENIQQYDSEFAQVREEIAIEKKKLHDEIGELRKVSEKLLGELRRDMEKAVDSLQLQTQKSIEKIVDSTTDRNKLGDMLENIAKKLKS